MHMCRRATTHLVSASRSAASVAVAVMMTARAATPAAFAAAAASAAGPSPSLAHCRRMSFTPSRVKQSVRALVAKTEAVEVIDSFPAIRTRLMITCEHASMRLPEPWKWPAEDSRLLGSHWSFDPGAEDFTRELVRRLPSVGVLSRFSRLLCDPNRPLGADTMFRTEADGQPVALNKDINKGEIAIRVEALYNPYHECLKAVHEVVLPKTVLSFHSFTPVYEGQTRTVEIGVLYNQEKDRELAEKFQTAFQSLGIVTALNEPWSAKDGFMYAAEQFSSPHTAVLMFEFRQDLVVQEEWRAKVVQQTEKVLREAGHK